MLIATVLIGAATWATLLFFAYAARKQLQALKLDLGALTVQSAYELRSTLASDGVAYAEQQALAMFKAHGIKWKASDKLRSALDFVRLTAATAGYSWGPDSERTMRLLIEANVAYLSGRVRPVALTARAPVEVVEAAVASPPPLVGDGAQQ